MTIIRKTRQLETVGDILKETAPPLGHNRPPVDEMAADEINAALAEIAPRVAELAGAAPRAFATDEGSAGRCADMIAMIRRARGSVDEIHERVKKPYLAAGRAVDAGANALRKKLDDAKSDIDKKLSTFAAQERQRQQAERQEVERLERERRALEQKPGTESIPLSESIIQRPNPAPLATGDVARLGSKIDYIPVANGEPLDPLIMGHELVTEAVLLAAKRLHKSGVKTLKGITFKEEIKANVR